MSLLRYFRRARWDRERREEIESYVQIETDENIARGMLGRDARDAARRKLGNRARIREEIYSMNSISSLDTLSRDVRYAVRGLRRNPTFSLVALLTLALGIGANTAVFSVVNSVLLRPLPYPKAEQLVGVWHKVPGAPGMSSVSGDLRLSPSMFYTYSEQNQTFQELGVWSQGNSTVTGSAEPEQVRTAAISFGVLEALNVPPAFGRWLNQADQTPGGRETVMLGNGYWQRRFGGDRSVIGRTITVESRPMEIVGVMPAGFQIVGFDPELIVPHRFDRNKLLLAGFGQQGIARLKPGVTVAQANADVARLLPIWERSWPSLPGAPNNSGRFYADNWRIAPAVRPLQQDVVGNVGEVLWVVMGTIGIVMLIACANVANLLLVRVEARQQELTIRAALGAGRRRIVGGVLLESVLLGLMGGAAGLALAYGGLKFLVSIGPANLPRLNEISLDARAFLFTFVASLLAGLVFGSIPAFKSAGARIANTIRGGGRASSASRERHRARDFLVVSQVTLAMVLLVSAGLMIRTFQALRHVEPGFTHPEQLQIMRVAIPQTLIPDPERAGRMEQDILGNLTAIPGVTSAAFTTAMPMEGLDTNWDEIMPEGRNDVPDNPVRMFKFVSPGYFQTIGTKLIAGRDYVWTDLYGHRPVAIVSENLAKELWGSPSAAIGKRIHAVRIMPWKEVIGVVQDTLNNGPQEKAPSIVYWPSMIDQLYPMVPTFTARNLTIVIRSPRTSSESFVGQVRQAVWSVNSNLPVASVQTMQDVADRSLARTSFTLVMLGIAGAMALLLGIIGIYGVISYAVSQRRREIGIRLALGAQQGELRGMFVRQGLVLTGIGVAVGLAAAASLARLMKAVVFGISLVDPTTYVTVPVILLAAAVIASYVPARRAAAVDPVEALKSE